jgi:hypothetical protein
MKIRATVLSFAVALALATWAPAVAEAIELVAKGTVVSKKGDTLVVRTDDHQHRIAFDIDRNTVLAEGVAVGQKVHVVYRANGPTGQTAQKVTLAEPAPKKR